MFWPIRLFFCCSSLFGDGVGGDSGRDTSRREDSPLFLLAQEEAKGPKNAWLDISHERHKKEGGRKGRTKINI